MRQKQVHVDSCFHESPIVCQNADAEMRSTIPRAPAKFHESLEEILWHSLFITEVDEHRKQMTDARDTIYCNHHAWKLIKYQYVGYLNPTHCSVCDLVQA